MRKRKQEKEQEKKEEQQEQSRGSTSLVPETKDVSPVESALKGVRLKVKLDVSSLPNSRRRLKLTVSLVDESTGKVLSEDADFITL